MKKAKLYETIMNDILDRIQNGELKAGDKIATEAELVEQYNVSRITVTRALRELEYKGLLKRIKKKGTYIRKPDEPKRETASDIPIPVIALLLPFSEDYGYDMLRGIEEVCTRQGYYVTYHNTRYNVQLEREYIGKILDDNLSGAIIYPVSTHINIDIYSKMLINKYPFVLIDRTIEGLDVPYVVSDNMQAGYTITSHLLKLGHTRIAFVCTALNEAMSVAHRYRGYCKALIEQGIAPKQEWLIEDHARTEEINSDDISVRLRINEARLNRLLALPDPPTAIVAVNDETALYLCKAALRNGIQIPGQLSVAGFDNLQSGELFEIPLTTVRQDFFGIGSKAAELVVSRCEGSGKPESQSVMLDTELILRQSTGKPSLIPIRQR